ncbi:splicing regulatory glutamine/lysine-rich protein 1-like [Macrobrachium rosenbergii]|uniref:splicing regulatory glutamine/lysine-rich protein 1-like n=1 Tax=Macrobrachium rosenbergii TaxID=79674 RepID=UPI0034D6D86E
MYHSNYYIGCTTTTDDYDCKTTLEELLESTEIMSINQQQPVLNIQRNMDFILPSSRTPQEICENPKGDTSFRTPLDMTANNKAKQDLARDRSHAFAHVLCCKLQHTMSPTDHQECPCYRPDLERENETSCLKFKSLHAVIKTSTLQNLHGSGEGGRCNGTGSHQRGKEQQDDLDKKEREEREKQRKYDEEQRQMEDAREEKNRQHELTLTESELALKEKDHELEKAQKEKF